MTLLKQAINFRQIFGQEILLNISRYGFIKKMLWDMQVRLIHEEASEFLVAAIGRASWLQVSPHQAAE